MTLKPLLRARMVLLTRWAPKSKVSNSVKKRIDYSKVPELKEEELKESIARGSGPGGQSVNKASNCVRLMHTPTGIHVRVHETRSLEKNRELARDRLRSALDNFVNKDESVDNQILRLERERREREKEKRRMKREERLRGKHQGGEEQLHHDIEVQGRIEGAKEEQEEREEHQEPHQREEGALHKQDGEQHKGPNHI